MRRNTEAIPREPTDMNYPDAIPAVTVEELDRLRRTGAPHLVLDVREAPELQRCRLDGARHVPMNEVPNHLDDLPRDRPVVVLCHHGVRSRIVVDYLRQAGLGTAVNLEGGIDAWAREIDDTTAVY